MQNDKTPVKIATLKIIYDSLILYHYRLESIIHDISSNIYKLSDIDRATLYEASSCAIGLKVLFEEYFEQAAEASAEQVFLPKLEFKNILSMARTIESAARSQIGNSGVWDH